MTTPVFDPVASAAARDAAIDQVEEAAEPDFIDLAYETISQLAYLMRFINTDAVWSALYVNTGMTAADVREPRALGAVMRRAQRDGLIRPTDTYLASDRVACHRRPLRIWRSLVFDRPPISQVDE